VLTDLHVHLRPDEPGTTPERYFTAANADRYREAAAERGIEELRTGARDLGSPVVPALGT
jgi:histidinol-phosphatase (PHP family)